MSSVVISGDTSGSITLSAPAVSGSNTITLPAATGELSMLGASGQTWTDVLVSRALSTTYTNSTGKPIFVSIIATQNSSSSGITSLTVGGVVISRHYSASASSTLTSVSGIVPPNQTYIVTTTNSITLSIWSELR
jgi:hypothetical protein